MPTPSLILVPARFKTGKLYTPLATTSGGTVLGASGDFNVTRATAATRVNSAGLIESVASGIPRLDYFASGGVVGCPALLVEPAGTNSALRSEELDNAIWTNALWGNWSNATTASSTTIAPDGSTNAEELTFTTGTSSRLQRITGIAASTTYTFSMYVMGKAGNSYQNGIFLRIATGFNNALVAISAATGRVDSTVSNTAWTRYSVTFTTPSSGVNEFNIGITTSNSGTNPNATMICWGAQLETGSVATSYIPTTTASVTRNADVISLSGAVSGSIGQTEGTIYAEVNYSAIAATKAIVTINDGTADNRIVIRLLSTTSISVLIRVATANNDYNVTIPAIPSSGTFKIALAYKANDYVLAFNGTTYASTTTRSVPATNAVIIGNNGGNADFFNDRIRAAALYTTRLTNAQLQALTTP